LLNATRGRITHVQDGKWNTLAKAARDISCLMRSIQQISRVVLCPPIRNYRSEFRPISESLMPLARFVKASEADTAVVPESFQALVTLEKEWFDMSEGGNAPAGIFLGLLEKREEELDFPMCAASFSLTLEGQKFMQKVAALSLRDLDSLSAWEKREVSRFANLQGRAAERFAQLVIAAIGGDDREIARVIAYFSKYVADEGFWRVAATAARGWATQRAA
jgi:hypothetical protein